MTSTVSAVRPAAVPDSTLDATMTSLGLAARAAAAELALAAAADKERAIRAAATSLRDRAAQLLTANQQDIDAATANGTGAAMLDRLRLDPKRIEAMAAGLEVVAALPDPIGTVLADWTQPNGLHFQRVRVPLGVIGIIYEARPNVTADAGALCLKAGNAAILRCGSDSFHSSNAIAASMREGLAAANLPLAAIQLVPTTDRAAVGQMLRMQEYIDVIVPRGGRSLIERVQNESRIPVFAHLDGINHVYLHGKADPAKALSIVMNAKLRRVTVCGAAETLLVDRDALPLLAPILTALLDAGCAIRGDATVCELEPRATPATEQDWRTEYLDAILSVRVVDDIDAAIAHVNLYGSHHTDAIVTEDTDAAERFLARIDSGIVLVNASTQFADGGEFGMGAEIGISTGKMHARGPVGAEQLTSIKYLVRGNGQIRPG